MKVCIYGAGAIGGQLAGRLSQGGADVSVVARGRHLEAIRKDGLRIQTPDGDFSVRVAASQDTAELGSQDVVFVTVKAPALAAVAEGIAPLLARDTTVVFAMNGIPWWYFQGLSGELADRRLASIDPGDRLRKAIGPERIVGAVVFSGSEVHEPGIITVDTALNRIILGEPDGSLSPRTAAIAMLLRAGGMQVEVTDRIRDEIWSKLMNNLSSGTMAILAGTVVKDIYAQPVCAAAARTMIAEGLAIARALGCDPSVNIEAKIAHASKLDHKPSILQDLELGRSMEINSIFAAPLALARMLEVPTPMLDLMVALATTRARTAGLYDGGG